MADEQKTEAAPQQPSYKPMSSMDPSALAAAFEKNEGVPPSAEAKAAPATPPASAQDDVPELVKKARDRDSQRKMMEQKEIEAAKPYVEALKAIPPHTAQAIARAIQSGDPVSLLSAAGMTHQQYTARLLGQQAPAEEASEKEAKAEEPNSEVLTLKQRLEQLERERENERIQGRRKEALSRMQTLLKDDPKYKHVAALGDYEGVERVILQYIQENGKPPGDTFEETVRLAAELREYDLKQEAKKWQKVLTPAQEAAQTAQARAPEQPPSAGNEPIRTLNNAVATQPSPPRSAPKSRKELIDLFIEKGDAALEGL